MRRRLSLWGVVLLVIGLVSAAGPTFASTTDGTIDTTSKYAWGENIGWVNFGTTEGNVHITDSALTGYAWGENVGWISLNCSNTSSCGTVDYKVANNANGTLTGYAWGENVGWIVFDPSGGGVTADSSGNFAGYAWGENIGWIVFNCSTTSSCSTVEYKVATDWRPSSSRGGGGGGASGGGVSGTSIFSTPASVPTSVPPPATTSTTEGAVAPAAPETSGEGALAPPPSSALTPPSAFTPLFPPPPRAPEPSLPERILDAIVPDFLRPESPAPTIAPPTAATLPKEAPPALAGSWELIDSSATAAFALAPLPREFTTLARKFPDLSAPIRALAERGASDATSVKEGELTIPTLTHAAGLPTTTTVPGQFSIPRGVPVAEMPVSAKRTIPSDVVFARSGGERVDLPVVVRVSEEGRAEQRVAVVAGKPLALVIKPDQPVERVRGYVVLRKARTRAVGTIEFPRDTFLARTFFATPAFASELPGGVPAEVEEELVLVEFDYTDPDGDGIYTAEIPAPILEGEYEVITVLDYENPVLASKEIRLTTVIDPEGYVYERSRGREIRVAGATVTLLRWNPETQQEDVWPGSVYQQENPQATDASGRYAFLVPEGRYRITVAAKGYLPHRGELFEVRVGSGIHEDIALTPTAWWTRLLDVRTAIILLLIAIIVVQAMRMRRQPPVPPLPPPFIPRNPYGAPPPPRPATSPPPLATSVSSSPPYGT